MAARTRSKMTPAMPPPPRPAPLSPALSNPLPQVSLRATIPLSTESVSHAKQAVAQQFAAPSTVPSGARQFRVYMAARLKDKVNAYLASTLCTIPSPLPWTVCSIYIIVIADAESASVYSLEIIEDNLRAWNTKWEKKHRKSLQR